MTIAAYDRRGQRFSLLLLLHFHLILQNFEEKLKKNG